MTRYGFAIKALPKPFETEDDESDDEEEAGGETGSPPDPGAPNDEAPGAPAPSSEPDPASGTEEDDFADPAADDASAETPEAPLPEGDDARPWAGDMYDEGDESDPASAFAAYTGTAGEEAWLDQAADGTLTGWVRDSTGQVWRYADADAWAIDVDDAQMTRTHGGGAPAEPTTPTAGEPGKQASLFPPQ